MVLKYQKDPLLDLLKNSKNEELEVLEAILIYDDDGNLNLFEELTKEIKYENNFPDRKAYWDLILAQYQKIGKDVLEDDFSWGWFFLILTMPPFFTRTDVEPVYLKLLFYFARKNDIEIDKEKINKKTIANLEDKLIEMYLNKYNKNIEEDLMNDLNDTGKNTEIPEKIKNALKLANIIALMKTKKSLSFSDLGMVGIGAHLINPLPFFIIKKFKKLFNIILNKQGYVELATIYIAALRQINNFRKERGIVC